MDEIETIENDTTELDTTEDNESGTAEAIIAVGVLGLAAYGAFELGRKVVKKAKFEYKAFKIVRKMQETDTEVSEES